jgi:macrolide-specific efflux system membrane fusion protein
MFQVAGAGTQAKLVIEQGAPGDSKVGTVAAEGRVVAYPGADVVVGAERGGRLVRVLVAEGDLVAKGALLAELESNELRASLRESRARLAEAEAEIRLAESNLKRRRGLAEQQIIAAHDLDQANRDLEIALARRETAHATLTRYEAQLEKTRILAPIAGTLILRHVDAGETIETGDKVATLADLDRLRIEAEADEADAGALSPGAPVAITAEGYPGQRWQGRVEEVPASVTLRRLKPQDPGRPTDTRILAVKVAFAEPTPLKLGTTVELRIAPTQR